MKVDAFSRESVKTRVARPIRIEFAGASSHITARGNERRACVLRRVEYRREADATFASRIAFCGQDLEQADS